MQHGPSRFSAMFQVKVAENHVYDKNRTLIMTKMGPFKKFQVVFSWETSEILLVNFRKMFMTQKITQFLGYEINISGTIDLFEKEFIHFSKSKSLLNEIEQ